ncbi:MAG: hypothetical protein EOP50_04325, partial [Sphingobacteriales bacterium]
MKTTMIPVRRTQSDRVPVRRRLGGALIPRHHRGWLLLILALLIGQLAFGSAAAAGPHPQVPRLQTALERYRGIAGEGGWPQIRATRRFFQQNITDPSVVQLKARLRASGDFSSDDNSALFTPELTTAVKRIQKRFGFPENGVVDAALLKELNVPVSKRIAQLEANLARVQKLPEPVAGTRLVPGSVKVDG